MKKIMGAVLAAAMLAGIATATDVSFSYKGANYFSGSDFTHKGRTDCVSVSLTDEVGGVVVDFDTTDVSANSSGDVRLFETHNSTTQTNKYDGGGTGLMPDEYYGWMNFALPLGQLQVTAGKWNGRNVNRVLTDRGDLEARDFELFKPGVINGTMGADSANLTFGQLGIVAAWTLADTLPGTLMVKVGMARYYDSEWNENRGRKWTSNNDAEGTSTSDTTNWTWNPEADWLAVKAGFLGEVSYWQEGAFRANLSVRSLNKHTYSFGAWISPELADTLQLTVGGTVATGKKWNGSPTPQPTETDPTTSNATAGTLLWNGSWSDRKTEWGIDFRLRLQVTDDLSITTMNNISSGYASGDSKGALWNMLNATYAIADNLTAAFTVQSVADLFCPAVKDSGAWTLIMSPSIAIQATERARVTASVRAQMDNNRNWTFDNMYVVVPVVFSFNY